MTATERKTLSSLQGKIRRSLLRTYGCDNWLSEREAVQEYYGHRLTFEEPDGLYRFVYRLSIYGRTIACSGVEHEVWEEAFDDLAELLTDGMGAYGGTPIAA